MDTFDLHVQKIWSLKGQRHKWPAKNAFQVFGPAYRFSGRDCPVVDQLEVSSSEANNASFVGLPSIEERIRGLGLAIDAMVTQVGAIAAPGMLFVTLHSALLALLASGANFPVPGEFPGLPTRGHA